MSSSAQVSVLFFAKASELTGCNQATLAVDSQLTVAQLRARVFTAFDCLLPIRDHVIVAVNEEYKDDESEVLALQDGDEIAVIPPISGG